VVLNSRHRFLRTYHNTNSDSKKVERFMSISLESKLSLIPDDQIVPELNTMLDKAKVRISWYGERLVSIDGYTGEVEINTLAKRYLRASPFNRHFSSSLEERLECYNLWERVQDLYKASSQELNSTWFYKHLTPTIAEFGSHYKRESIFEFTSEQFKELWPDGKPNGVSLVIANGRMGERWTATKEMVEDVMHATGV
jgi:hypothetical protein